MNTIKTDRKEQLKKNIKSVNKTLCGICIGAAIAGTVAALKMNKKNSRIETLSDINRDLFDIIERQEDIFKDNANLRQEIQIRDCMVMEGIDGDEDIYARRMHHFRDFKIETGDISQSGKHTGIYCSLAAIGAAEAYGDYTEHYRSEFSEIPQIHEDDELPF